MASAIDFLPTISSCQAVSQMNLATARWRPHAGYGQSATTHTTPPLAPGRSQRGRYLVFRLSKESWDLPDDRRKKRLEGVEEFAPSDFVGTHLEYCRVSFRSLFFRTAVCIIIHCNGSSIPSLGARQRVRMPMIRSVGR